MLQIITLNKKQNCIKLSTVLMPFNILKRKKSWAFRDLKHFPQLIINLHHHIP